MNKSIDPLFTPEELCGMSAAEVDEASELIQQQMVDAVSMTTMVNSIKLLAQANGLVWDNATHHRYSVSPLSSSQAKEEKLGEFMDFMCSFDFRVVDKYLVPALRSAIDSTSVLSDQARSIVHEQLNLVVFSLRQRAA